MTDHDHQHDQAHVQGHDHDHDHDHAHIDWEVFGPILEREAELHIPLFDQAADWLRERFDGGAAGPERILDVGSGPGVFSALFAGHFPAAEVVAVDGTEALLARARARADSAGYGDRVRTQLADFPDGLDSVGTADLVWASKVLHHIGDQRAAVARLAHAVRPGGLIALVEGGLTPRNFPRDIGIGRPGLQARLDAVNEDWFAEMRAALPGAKEEVEDWPALLAAAGLTVTGSRTFLLDLPAPLSEAARQHLVAAFTRTRERMAERLDADDVATLDRLIDPEDEAGLLRRPDVFLLSAQTVHTATLPAAAGPA